MRTSPDLVADGHRRIWTKVFTLSGQPYAKIDGRLRPVIWNEPRGVYIALGLSLTPKLARFLK